MKKLLLLIFIFSISLNAQDIVWNSDQSIYAGGSGTNIRPRIIALDDSHGIILWGNQNNQSIQYSVWEDELVSGKMDLDINNRKAFITSWASTEMAGRENFVYIVFKEDPAEAGNIYLLRSEDYGKTFSQPIVAVKPEGFYSRFPGVAIDKNFQPIVSYMQFKTDWSEPKYVSMRSSNFGSSFDPSTEVTDESKGEACDCCPVTMETDGDRVAVFYRNNRNNIRNMSVSISENSGLSFDLNQELDTADWLLLSCPATGGDGFFNGQELHTSWTSARTGTSKVYYSKLDLNTQKITAFVQMNHSVGRGFQQVYPRIAGNRDTVGLCWNELVSGMDILFSYFVKDQTGELIVNTLRINESTNGNQASADIAFVNGRFHLCWQDMNDHSIKYKTGSFKQTSITDNSVAISGLRLSRNHFQTRVQCETQFERWEILSLSGKPIMKATGAVDCMLENIPRGIYLLTVFDGSNYSFHKIIH